MLSWIQSIYHLLYTIPVFSQHYWNDFAKVLQLPGTGIVYFPNMDVCFTISFRGTLVVLERSVLEALPTNSNFTKSVKRQTGLTMEQYMENNRTCTPIYLNRSASLFSHILDFIEHGELHYPHNICPIIVTKELAYWGYTKKDLGDCCLDRILKDREDTKTLESLTRKWRDSSPSKESNVYRCLKARKKPGAIAVEHQDKDASEQIGTSDADTDSTPTPSGKGFVEKQLLKIVFEPLTNIRGQVGLWNQCVAIQCCQWYK